MFEGIYSLNEKPSMLVAPTTVAMQQVLLQMHTDIGKTITRKTFAFVLGGSSIRIPIAASTTNVLVTEDTFYVQLNEKAFVECLIICKHTFIVKVVLSKGESPWKLSELKSRLSTVWDLQTWKLISLGKCFFFQVLHSEEDKN